MVYNYSVERGRGCEGGRKKGPKKSCEKSTKIVANVLEMKYNEYVRNEGREKERGRKKVVKIEKRTCERIQNGV